MDYLRTEPLVWRCSGDSIYQRELTANAKLLRFGWAIKHLLRDKATMALEGFYPSHWHRRHH